MSMVYYSRTNPVASDLVHAIARLWIISKRITRLQSKLSRAFNESASRLAKTIHILILETDCSKSFRVRRKFFVLGARKPQFSFDLVNGQHR